MPGHRKNMKKVPKKITKKPTQKPTQKLSAFGKAFFEARRDKGPNSTFPFKGKQYSTVTADQVKAAGFKTLREYSQTHPNTVSYTHLTLPTNREV